MLECEDYGRDYENSTREGKEDLEKDCRKRTGQGRMDKMAAQNREGWTDSVVAFCTFWHGEKFI